ncbi:2-oxo-4-hydroxy-4-carboxy-5-ureidoimidazoline decarboxylase [Streptomyces phaeofaciens JCM 4814]|uniref:2-oxo-4-hydroxy-4-carboxy-5-ureidoimidazoline decarboxylase n=1 Tax=Streptomyces phaeofaciens TaxID=68254 RepID=A0A918H3R1_9ACTN|nr:2-oxo-4-hydroxy-4-carboxy-5-ureidoimidazoline decarboxylase [Streptomyces phaeofaciens]
MTRGSTLPAHPLSRPTGRVAIPGQTRTSPAPPLDGFNTAPSEEAHHALLACLRSPRWARRIADHRPYPTAEALLAASDEAAYDLTAGDLAEALAGECLPTLPEGTYEAAHTALGAAHAAYEARFGHVFVICLDGVPQDEVLDHVLGGIRSRLTNDPEEERVVTAEELRRLARQRLTQLL